MTYDLPTEVVTMILSNLCQTDLLNCRLVNHAWNRESLLVFRKSSFKIHLNICQTGGNANKYIEFASTKNPQLVLPIHLSLESSKLPHPKILEIVTSLQALCGPDSIQSLTLHIHCHCEYDKNVIILLSMISHALKTLRVRSYFVQLFLLDLMKDLSFPNVASLKCIGGYLESPILLVQAQFILKCPNLKQLCFENQSPDVRLPPSLQKLAVLTLTDPWQLHDNILECSRLHTLKIYKYKTEDRQIIYQILESIKKTLKSLTIGIDTIFQFPRLPYLQSIRVHNMTQPPTAVEFNPGDMNINSETLPSLKLVRLPFIFSLRKGSPLPSVKTLILYVPANRGDRNPCINPGFLTQENFKNLKITFPSAATICLKQKRLEEFQCKTVLKELICSELATQIKEIQIKSGHGDILGEVLEQNMMPPQITMIYSGNRVRETEELIRSAFELWTWRIGIQGIEHEDEGTGLGRRIVFSEESQSGHKMTNVKKVTMVFRTYCEYVDGKFSDFKLNLMSIAKSLPSLTEIKLIGIERELYLKQFDDLAIEYPNLHLRVTKLEKTRWQTMAASRKLT